MKYVIIGSSAAGLSGLETLHALEPEADKIVITADGPRPHSRILTSYLLGKKITEDKIYIKPEDYFHKMNTRLMAGVEVTKLDTEQKRVELDDGSKISYDRLLIASGASSKLPEYTGARLNGVFTLRDLADVEKINHYLAGSVNQCILLGGGLVSMKAAEAFYERGYDVSIVIRSPLVLSQMLDSGAAHIVEKYLVEDKGFNIYKGEAVESITGSDRVQGVKLHSGRVIEGQLVLVGKGVSPNTFFVDDRINHTGDGIVVDDYLQTTAADVYAAGDVTVTANYLSEKEKVNNAIWPDAVWQGRIAAYNMTGQNRIYDGGLNLNALKVLGLVFFAIGKVRLRPEEEDKYQVYIKNIPDKKVYRKLVFQDNILVGVITIGRSEDVGLLYTLIKKRARIEDKADYILNHGLSYASIIKDNMVSTINKLTVF